MSARCIKTATIPASESQCILPDGHSDGCIGEGQSKRHLVLKAEPGNLGVAGIPMGKGAKQERPRFMVRLGGGKVVPVITPEEALDESGRSFERDRLLATALAAEANVVAQAPPKGLADQALRYLNEKVEERTKEIFAEHKRLKIAVGERLWFITTVDGTAVRAAPNGDEALARWAEDEKLSIVEAREEAIFVGPVTVGDVVELLEGFGNGAKSFTSQGEIENAQTKLKEPPNGG